MKKSSLITFVIGALVILGINGCSNINKLNLVKDNSIGLKNFKIETLEKHSYALMEGKTIHGITASYNENSELLINTKNGCLYKADVLPSKNTERFEARITQSRCKIENKIFIKDISGYIIDANDWQRGIQADVKYIQVVNDFTFKLHPFKEVILFINNEKETVEGDLSEINSCNK